MIEHYIAGRSKVEFEESIDFQDKVIRRLEIIGEAIKRLPQDFHNQHTDIEWKKAAGMRDI